MINFEQSMIGALDRVYLKRDVCFVCQKISINVWNRKVWFPHAMWNMNLRVQNDLPRTNNDLEGWHNRFAGAFQQRHAHSLKGCKTIQRGIITQLPKLLAWAAAQTQRRIYSDITERIQTLGNGYANNNVIGFLTGISYNLA